MYMAKFVYRLFLVAAILVALGGLYYMISSGSDGEFEKGVELVYDKGCEFYRDGKELLRG
jgi:hypothetical protein